MTPYDRRKNGMPLTTRGSIRRRFLHHTSAMHSTYQSTQFVLLWSAAEPFNRPGIKFSVGPERYSFARLERDWSTQHHVRSAFLILASPASALVRRPAFPSGIQDAQSDCIRGRGHAHNPHAPNPHSPQWPIFEAKKSSKHHSGPPTTRPSTEHFLPLARTRSE